MGLIELNFGKMVAELMWNIFRQKMAKREYKNVEQILILYK